MFLPESGITIDTHAPESGSALKTLPREFSLATPGSPVYKRCRPLGVAPPAPFLTISFDIPPEQAANPREGYEEEGYEEGRVKANTPEAFGRIGEVIDAEKRMAMNARRTRGRVREDVRDDVSSGRVNEPDNGWWSDLL